jgi:general secretion pathway protein K
VDKDQTNQHKPLSSNGMALISALLVIIVITSILSTLYYNQTVKLRRIENTTAVAQSKWLLHAMTDGIRYFLQDNLKNGRPVNHFGELWAIPVSDTNFEAILKKYQIVNRSVNTRNIFVSYKIEDAQSTFNLANLVETMNDARETTKRTQQMFRSIVIGHGLSDTLATALIKEVQSQVPRESARSANTAAIHLHEGLLFEGMQQSERVKLQSFVSILPEKTQINVNTAAEPILRALIPNATPTTLQKILTRRLVKPFVSAADFQEYLSSEQPGATVPGDTIGVRTDYFKVYMAIRNDEVTISRSVLVSRKIDRSPVTEVIKSEMDDFRVY